MSKYRIFFVCIWYSLMYLHILISGVKFNYINGDIMTNALIAVAHRVAMECDIIYSTRNGPLFSIIFSSVVDPDPVRSETFIRIRIRKNHFRCGHLRIRNEFEATKKYQLKNINYILSKTKNLPKSLYLSVICNLTHP